MNNLMEQIKEYAIFILILFLGLLVAVLAIIPWTQDIFKQRGEIQAQNKRLEEKLKPKVNLLANQDLEELKTAETYAVLALPPQKDALYILNAFEKIEFDSGVELRGLQFSSGTKETETEGLKEIGFSLSTEGEYANLTALLKNLENSLPLIKMNSMNVASRADTGGLTISLGIETYYLPEKALSSNREAAVEVLTDKESEALQQIQSFRRYPLVPSSDSVGKTNPFR